MLNVEYPATIRPLPDSEEDAQLKKFGRQLNDCVVDMASLNDSAPDNFLQNIMRHENIRDLDILSDWAASITTCDNSKLQKVLDTYHLVDLVNYSLFLIKVELAALRPLNIRRFVLEKQLKVEDDKSNDDIQKFQGRMDKLSSPEVVTKRFEKEKQLLQDMSKGSDDYAKTCDYLEVLTTIPWGNTTEENQDLDAARKILDEGHEGLDDIKDRIVQLIARTIHKGGTKGAVLLIVGPPGTGKTSIGESIAKALHHNFVRVALGGVDDESVIKGFGRTYTDSRPGKPVTAIQKAGSMDPVIMLDEIDKLVRNHGDPAVALLEVLNPEQNNSFTDHYLGEELELSDCLFICTANLERIYLPPPARPHEHHQTFRLYPGRKV